MLEHIITGTDFDQGLAFFNNDFSTLSAYQVGAGSQFSNRNKCRENHIELLRSKLTVELSQSLNLVWIVLSTLLGVLHDAGSNMQFLFLGELCQSNAQLLICQVASGKIFRCHVDVLKGLANHIFKRYSINLTR